MAILDHEKEGWSRGSKRGSFYIFLNFFSRFFSEFTFSPIVIRQRVKNSVAV